MPGRAGTSYPTSRPENFFSSESCASIFMWRFSLLPRQLVEIDIAAGDDHADSPASEDVAVLQDGRQRYSARRFHDDLHPLPDQLHRIDDFLLGSREDVGDVLADEVPGKLLQRHLKPVRDRVRGVVGDDVTSPETAISVVGL